ncbi:phosphatase PAP2 family protein [Streptomyces phaeochromogenes]
MTSVPDRRSSLHAPDSQDGGRPVPGPPVWVLGPLGLLFALLTWQAAVDGPVRRADERLAGEIRHSRLPAGAAEFLADLGNLAVAVPVLLAVVVHVSWRARRADLPRWWVPSLAALVAIAAVPALVVPLKEAIGRTGPPGMAGDGYYPSGHTATAAVAYGAAVLLLLPWLHSRYRRRELAIGCLVLVTAVGFGLVRRGYHWPLDVAGSWCLSAMLLLGLAMVTRPSSSSDTARQPK